MTSDCRDLYPTLEYLGSATRYVNEISEIIDQVALFDQLTIPEVESLCGFMHCFGAPRDSILLPEGKTGDFLLIILTGEVKVAKDAGDEMRTIATAGPGTSLGEMSMIDGEPRFASCVTVEPTDFAVLSRQSLSDVLRTMPRLGNKILLVLLQMMTRRLRNTSNTLLPYITGVAL
jgi:CRP/FNR family cyclic AMP-dependent transcriptional regulator